MITLELLLKIAKLAHLEVKDSEADALQGSLSAIFDYMKTLEKVDVSHVEAMSHVLEASNVFRVDEVVPSLPVEDLLQNAPDSSGRFIRVPIIVEPGSEH